MEPRACSSEKKASVGTAGSTRGSEKSTGCGLDEEKKKEGSEGKEAAWTNADGREVIGSGQCRVREVSCAAQTEGESV